MPPITAFFARADGKPSVQTPKVQGTKRKTTDSAVRQAQKVLATAKKAKEEAKEAALTLSDQLRQLERAGQLHKLGDLTTNQLKAVCMENNCRYGGPKYELVKRLREHVENYRRVQKKTHAREAASGGDEAAAVELEFIQQKGFKSAWNLLGKKAASLSAISSARRQLDILIGASEGMDAHLLTAITGPNAKQYNGSRGEAGIEAHRDVAQAWVDFLSRNHSKLSLAECERAFCAVWKSRPTEAYGFDAYGEDDFMRYYVYKRSPFSEVVAQFSDEKKEAWEEARVQRS